LGREALTEPEKKDKTLFLPQGRIAVLVRKIIPGKKKSGAYETKKIMRMLS